MQTTLNKIRQHFHCSEGWIKLLKHLNKTRADDEPLALITILDSNGLDDTLWCMRAVEGFDKEIRLYAVWCARQVQHLMTDKRSLEALDITEKFARGEVTKEKLDAAWSAAWDAASDAASDAAWAAWAAAGAAASDAASHAAWAAAWAAASDAESDAAWAAASDAQEKELRRILSK